MSKSENFDDYIRQEFSNYSPDVSPHIWERIFAEREKRKPTGFWFTFFANKAMLWLAVLILTGAIGTGLFVLHSSTDYNNKINQNTSSLIIANSKGGVSNNKSSLIKAGTNHTSYDSVTHSQLSKNVQDEKEIVTGKINAAKRNNTSLLISQNVSEKAKQIALDSNYDNAATVTKKLITVNKRAISFTKKNNSIDNNVTSATENKLSAIDQNFSLNNRYNDSINSVNRYFQNRFSSEVEKLSFNVANGSLSARQKNIPAVNLPECPAIEKNAAGNKRYLEVYIGPDYGIRTMTDTANSAYLLKRKESSSFTSAFSAGVGYTKVFSNSMSLKAALNFSQINESFSYVQGNVVQITYIIDPNTGDTTGSYTVKGTRYIISYNHYRNIDIPLTIGYELGNGKLHTNINVGIIANIYSWQKGDVLDTSYQPVNITTGEGSKEYQFKTNVGLGATGGVSFYYRITDQLNILAQPYVRYNFEPMSTNNLSLKEKYTTIGLHLGLRFDLH